jgi:hypothetical protein
VSQPPRSEEPTSSATEEPKEALIVPEAALTRVVREAVARALGVEGRQGAIADSRASRVPKQSPLSIGDFSAVLQRVQELGVTFTPDVIPQLQKLPSAPSDFQEQVAQLAEEYPTFLEEFGQAVRHALAGWSTTKLGTPDQITAKARAIEPLLSEDFRCEFFFRNATKLPRFEELDWEIVVKVGERGVSSVPGTMYAILKLGLTDEMDLVFAADGKRVRAMLAVLQNVLNTLERSKDHGPTIRSSTSPVAQAGDVNAKR